MFKPLMILRIIKKLKVNKFLLIKLLIKLFLSCDKKAYSAEIQTKL